MDSSREGGPGRGPSSSSRQGDESGRSQGAGAPSSSKRNREPEAESRGVSAATPSSRLVSPKARNLAELPRSDLQPSARKSLGTDFGSGNSPQTPRPTSSTNRNGVGVNGNGPAGTPSTPSSSNQNDSNRTPSTVATGRGSDGAPNNVAQAGSSTPTSSILPNKPALDVNGSIWGTNINNEEVSAVIRQFLTDFKLVDLDIAILEDRRVLFQEENPEEFLGETDDREDGWNYPADLSDLVLNPLRAQQAREMPYYMELLQSLIDVSSVDANEQGNTVLNVGIDAQHIMAFHASSGEGQRLYRQLINYPKEIIPLFDIQLNAQFSEMYFAALQPSDETAAAPRVRARVFNLEQVTRMRALDPTDIDTLVAIKGMVIRTNAITPDMKIGHFKCTACDYGVDVRLSGGRLEDPASCEHCGARKTMELVHNRCLFLDKQAIKIQETPESIPEGETPLTLQVFAYEDMVDTVLPGDRVTITGVFRAQGQKVVARARRLRSVFSTYIDAIHMAKNDKDRMTAEDPSKDAVAGAEGKPEIKEYTADFKYSADVQKSADAALVERVNAMSREPDLYSRLAHSLAPSVWELDDVKKGILLQLFGGCNKNLGSLGKIRGEINVLLCGDPGTAKSQLLSYVHRIAPRGMYTSGTGSSAVGLTAYITKDPESKEPVLESGALVLSDRGVCCIDEFDKMSDSTRSILHEVMEQQTVSIAKAGIIATLNARTSILASANPKESRYNPAESVVENLQLPPTLLSRFDLLYLILDKVDPATDARLAHHLVTLHWPEDERLSEEAQQGAPRHFTRQQVMEYISYVKKHYDPQISTAAQEELVKGYAEMRRSGMAGGRRTISATTRQLESLIRLGEAHARMRMSQVVGADDILEAIRLMRTATQQAAMDPRTGTIDMNLIATGHAASEASTITAIADCLREFLPTRASGSRKFSDLGTIRKEAAVVLEQLVGTIPNDSDLRTALRMLADEDEPVLSYSRTGGQDVVKLLSTRRNERAAYNAPGQY